ncbi:MAG: response regulator, partial [Pseudomonadota bacterium]
MSESPVAKILVVDDNLLNRKKLKLAVNKLGYTALTAEGGQDALTMLESGDFDAVLLDLLMPEMDGFEVLRRAKLDKHLWDIPIIIV